MLNDSSEFTADAVDPRPLAPLAGGLAGDHPGAAARPGGEQPQQDSDGAAVAVDDALVTCLVEVEQHVGADGWGQAPRLFSLVRTAELLRAEPSLAEQLAGLLPDSFTAIEDVEIGEPASLEEALQSIRWPSGVDGCAAVFENPAVGELPDQAVAPDLVGGPTGGSAPGSGQTCRVVVGVLRDGTAQGVVRLGDGSLRGGAPTWAPNVTAALRETLEAEDAASPEQDGDQR